MCTGVLQLTNFRWTRESFTGFATLRTLRTGFAAREKNWQKKQTSKGHPPRAAGCHIFLLLKKSWVPCKFRTKKQRVSSPGCWIPCFPAFGDVAQGSSATGFADVRTLSRRAETSPRAHRQQGWDGLRDVCRPRLALHAFLVSPGLMGQTPLNYLAHVGFGWFQERLRRSRGRLAAKPHLWFGAGFGVAISIYSFCSGGLGPFCPWSLVSPCQSRHTVEPISSGW